MNENRKVLNIQGLRAIAALLVVSSHFVPIEAKYGQGLSVTPSWLAYGVCGADLFFVISGFVMVAVTSTQFHSRPKAARFLSHRITRIYPLYWIYSLLVVAVYLVKPAFVNASQGHQFNVVASFLLLPQKTLPSCLLLGPSNTRCIST